MPASDKKKQVAPVLEGTNHASSDRGSPRGHDAGDDVSDDTRRAIHDGSRVGAPDGPPGQDTFGPIIIDRRDCWMSLVIGITFITPSGHPVYFGVLFAIRV